ISARAGEIVIVLIAGMMFYEVVARYVFLSPTGWTQDVAVTAQVWFTYMGMAYVLRKRELIRITAVLVKLGPGMRKILEGFSLIVICAFCVIATVYGTDTVLDSIRLGRRQPTMLEMPNWISELPVIVGFFLLGVQSFVELIRLPFRPAPEFSIEGAQEHALVQDSRT
ncbi:MAG: TRAP transporter small permease, partial [Rhodospirillales bacterium]